MSEAATPTRREVEAKIVARAWTDESYRTRLKEDPRAAVAEETGIAVPETVTIEVLEETPEKAYLVIPVRRVALADGELDVAGGGLGYVPAQYYDPYLGTNQSGNQPA
jgi:hypothetical protein